MQSGSEGGDAQETIGGVSLHKGSYMDTAWPVLLPHEGESDEDGGARLSGVVDSKWSVAITWVHCFLQGLAATFGKIDPSKGLFESAIVFPVIPFPL
jgi:hypothetical protein